MKALAAFLALTVLTLALLGGSILASVSSIAILRQQGFSFSVALLAFGAILLIPHSFWTRKPVVAAMAAVIIFGLAAVHIPGLSHASKGATRWITIGGRYFQPSELVKITFILLLSWWMSGPAQRAASSISEYKRRVLIPIAALAFVAAGFLAQGDFGSVIMLSAAAVPLMLIGGARFHRLLLYGAVAVAVMGTLTMNNPERRSRVMAKLAPLIAKTAEAKNEAVSADDRHHVNQSLLAFQAGGKTGRGIGESIYKHKYLPENHTDFVLAMVGEEWGFAGTSACIGLFFIIFLIGLAAAARAPDIYSSYLAFGLTLHICLSAAVNAAVVTDMVPTKGLALPFISAGGSNLLCSVIAAAFIISICWRSKEFGSGSYKEEDAYDQTEFIPS